MGQIVSLQDILSVVPMIMVFVFSLFPLTFKLLNQNREIKASAVALTALTGLILAMAWSLFFHTDNQAFEAFNKAIVHDGMAKWANSLICFLGGFALFISLKNVNTSGKQFSEHVFLLLNSVVGMMILIWSNDLIVSFIGIEIMSLALYVLVALSHEQTLSKEAAFKYFILGSLASAIFLYGVALLYGAAGTTYIPEIAGKAVQLQASSAIFPIGLLLTVVGLLFKISIFPFHAWTPDVYQGAPTPVTAFMSTGVKVATFVLLMRLATSGMLKDSTSIITLLQWLAVLTILIGNIGAIVQQNMKRMLSYSSIAHSGYILVGIIVLIANPDYKLAVTSILFYLFTYAIANVGSFAFISLHESKEDHSMQVNEVAGMSQSHPWLAMVFAVFMLSLAGIPPLAGFFGKFYLFSAAVSTGFYWIAVWGVMGSVISVYYYLRPVVLMYMEQPSKPIQVNRDESAQLTILLSLLFVLVVGLASGMFLSEIERALSFTL